MEGLHNNTLKIIIVLLLLCVFTLTGLFVIYVRMQITYAAFHPRLSIQEALPGEELLYPPRYDFTNEEVYLLAQLLCGDKNTDGDGEYDIDFKNPLMRPPINYAEVNKVFGVVMNRVHSKDFPNTVTEVILQPRQFSVMPRNLKADPSEVALKAAEEWCKAYNSYDTNTQTIPENHLYFHGNGFTNTTREHYR